uniref:ORF170 n=1 Tax=Leptospirillum ferrooxidans TaxID=180 RepID=Q58KB7_9BACT|nr:ORF170 [Leptospirillum ferrooxidans]
MKCPCCGAAELIHDTRDMPTLYKGENTMIPAVTGDFCPACEEVILNREHGARYSELIGQFHRQVNAAYVDPGYIAKVRKKLDLDQRQAAEDFGGLASMPSHATRTARPSRPCCSRCLNVTPIYLMKSGRRNARHSRTLLVRQVRRRRRRREFRQAKKCPVVISCEKLIQS